MIDKLTFLDVYPAQLLAVFLAALLAVAVFVIVIGLRNRSDRRAGAVARARRPRRMPSNLATRMWDFDSHGRTW